MVLGGNIAIEAFKDRSSDGPSRPLAAVVGVTFAVVGASMYGSSETGDAAFPTLLRPYLGGLVLGALSIDFTCRVPIIFRWAMEEAKKKKGPF
jgi:hypothetical protein